MNNKDAMLLEHIQMLTVKQQQLAQEIQNGHTKMQGLAKRVWRIQEEERKFIARELHDGVGQLLTALINQLELANTQTKINGYSQLIELARQALADTRHLSRVMRPRILDDLGLHSALKWMVRMMAEGQACKIDLNFLVDEELDDELSTLCFRIIQESLTNCARHAHANHINITVNATEHSLKVSVMDDGCGFNVSEVLEKDSFGLLGMQDRVAGFGGQLNIDSSTDSGTHISLFVPR